MNYQNEIKKTATKKQRTLKLNKNVMIKVKQKNYYYLLAKIQNRQVNDQDMNVIVISNAKNTSDK